jgi:hypothetical protein
MLGWLHDMNESVILLGCADPDPVAFDTLGAVFNGYAPSPAGLTKDENVPAYVSALLTEIAKRLLARHDVFFSQELPVAEYPLVAGYDDVSSVSGVVPVRVSVGPYPEVVSRRVRFMVQEPNEVHRFNRVEVLAWASAPMDVAMGYLDASGATMELGTVSLTTAMRAVWVDIPAGSLGEIAELYLRTVAAPAETTYLLVERVSLRFSPAPIPAPAFPQT